MREEFVKKMRKILTMREEIVLKEGTDLTFLGLEMHRMKEGIAITQKRFITHLLEKHGLSDDNVKPMTTVQMEFLIQKKSKEL